jgi:hypothetical protein
VPLTLYFYRLKKLEHSKLCLKCAINNQTGLWSAIS